MPTIYRNPVPDQDLPRPLPCLGESCKEDRTPAAGEDPQTAPRKASTYICRNHEKPGQGKPPNPGGCQTRAFLYPRGQHESGFHFHQGIDIGFKEGLGILAVMGGVVEHATRAWTPGFTGYGNVAVIKGDDGRYYLYAHCSDVLVEKGARVAEKALIARTGRTYYSSADHSSLMETAPHLHFEISREPYPKPKIERTLDGAHPEVREDPLLALAALGPWGTGRTFYLPTGPRATAARLEQLHRAVEKQPAGGYYPVGANNLWHGGVHLFASAGSVIKAPFPGRIVAARLDEDPLYANRQFGGTNFILMRHELPNEIAKRWKEGERKPATSDASPPKDARDDAQNAPKESAASPMASAPPRRSVGGPKATNAPDDVKEVARMLRSIPRPGNALTGEEDAPPRAQAYYESPRDPATGLEPDFVDAIRAFQAAIIEENHYRWQADGLVKVGGITWQKLREKAGPPTDGAASEASQEVEDEGDDATSENGSRSQGVAPAGDDAETSNAHAAEPAPQTPDTTPIWVLFMHVEAVALDARQARKVPWLARVKTPETKAAEESAKKEEERDYEEQKKAFDEREADDLEEAHAHELQGTVGLRTSGKKQLPQQNLGPDVVWVKQRLLRSGFYQGAIDESVDETFLAALSDFQKKFVPVCQEKGKGYLVPKKHTMQKLQKTRSQLGLDKAPIPPGQWPGARLTVDDKYMTRFRQRGRWEVTRVVTDLDVEVDAGEPLWTVGHGSAYRGEGLTPLVHWEIFSEEALFANWPKLEDANDDLTMDACEKLIAAVEAGEGVGQGDGILTQGEVAKFYGSDAAATARTLQCKFRGEWAADFAAVSSALAKLKAEVVGEVEEAFGPYTFWQDAAAVLPSSPHVWHYNPVAFLAEYARTCGATTGELSVEVYIKQRLSADVKVALLRDGQVVRPLQMSQQNTAVRFLELLPGQYAVMANANNGSAYTEEVTLAEGETTHVRLGEPPRLEAIDPSNPFKNYQRMSLTMCREGLSEKTLRPHYPRRGNSGVTLGFGYDLGKRTPAQVREHLEQVKVVPEYIESLMPAVGMDRAHGAEQWFDANREALDWPITEVQRSELLSLVYPEYEKEAQERALRYSPPVAAEDYAHLHESIRELLADLVYVGAPYAAKNATGSQVNTIIADTAADDAEKLRRLRSFVENMPTSLQSPGGKTWRLKYIDASLETLEHEP